MPEQLSVGSLFSGIPTGGIDLGLQRAGMAIRWQVEIDDWCRRVLAKHWPDVTRYGDITQIDPAELEPVDVIAGGFPCQSVSLAGRRKGQDDARWLWPSFIGIVRVVRPRFVLVENTPGLLSLGMGDVLGDLAACGFDAEWSCVSACSMGAPHTRERVFIVAYSTGIPEREPAIQAQSITALGETWAESARSAWWASEPRVERVAHGIPGRVDRDRGLGNAVVPQVVEHIGRMIVEAAR